MLVSRTISLVLDTCVYPHAARSNLLRVDFRCRCSICQDLLGRKGERETQPFRLSYHASSHIVSAATVSDSSARSFVSAPTISGPQATSLGTGRLERVNQFESLSTVASTSCLDWNLSTEYLPQGEPRVAFMPR